MRGFFKRRSRTHQVEVLDAISHVASGSSPSQASCQPINGEPVRTGSNLIAAPSPAWHSPEDHAVALLQWMRGPGGRVGQVPASELMKAHADMCAEYFWELVPWIPVARAFRKLLNDPKHRYASHKSRRAVIYLIPPSGE